jgi:hypothetical protein
MTNTKGQSFVETAIFLSILVVIAVTCILPLGKTVQAMLANAVNSVNAVSNYSYTQQVNALSQQSLTGYNKNTAYRINTGINH